MADIFISYKREDKSIAKDVADKLSSLGWSVWWDHDIPAGKDYDHVIEDELSRCRCVVVLWTEQSVLSRNVKDEANVALKNNKLIPVILGNATPPMGFRMIQGVIWKNQSKPDTYEFEQLKKNIAAMMGESPEPYVENIKKPSRLFRNIMIVGIPIALLLFIYFQYIRKNSPEQNFRADLLKVIDDAPNKFGKVRGGMLGINDYGKELIGKKYGSKVKLASIEVDTIVIYPKVFYYKSIMNMGYDSARLQIAFNELKVKIRKILKNYEVKELSNMVSFSNETTGIMISLGRTNNFFEPDNRRRSNKFFITMFISSK